MKRTMILGCGGASLVTVLGLAAFFYFTVFRPAESVMADLDQMARLKALNDGVRKQDAFIAPPDGNLTEDQLARFSRVQSTVRMGLGTDYPTLDERADRLKGLATVEDGAKKPKRLGIRDAILAFRGLGPVLLRTKELQVNALNTEHFSVEEYRWVRRSFYRGLGFSRSGVYFEDFAATLKQGKGMNFEDDEDSTPSTDRNRELAAAYAESVQAWYPFLVFGF